MTEVAEHGKASPQRDQEWDEEDWTEHGNELIAALAFYLYTLYLRNQRYLDFLVILSAHHHAVRQGKISNSGTEVEEEERAGKNVFLHQNFTSDIKSGGTSYEMVANQTSLTVCRQ
eukprot:749170-Hanusia_phi.AAC.1